MDKIIYIDKCGKKRDGIVVNCLTCKKDFIGRKPYNNHETRFCSLECRFNKPDNKVEVECAWCKNKIKKSPSKLKNSRSGLYFCNRLCKEKAQSLAGGLTEIMPDHYGTGDRHYRSLFDKSELFCRRCEYKEFLPAVDIHHIDENRDNNHKENLIPLCANCHKGLHCKLWDLTSIKPDLENKLEN